MTRALNIVVVVAVVALQAGPVVAVAIPGNDSVGTATHVSTLPWTASGVAVSNAGDIVDNGTCSPVTRNTPGVAYKFTAAAPGDVTVELGSPSGTTYVLFYSAPNESASAADLTLLSPCSQATQNTQAVTTGQAYYVIVVNDGGSTSIQFYGDATLPVDLVSVSVR